MYTCTNACAQSNQGVGLQEGWLGHTWGQQGHTDLCGTIKCVWSRRGKQGGHAYCTAIYTHSTQSVGPEKRYLAYASGATQGHPCLHVTNSSKQFCMPLCKGSGPNVGSQVGMHKCLDACTYSNKSFC